MLSTISYKDIESLYNFNKVWWINFKNDTKEPYLEEDFSPDILTNFKKIKDIIGDKIPNVSPISVMAAIEQL